MVMMTMMIVLNINGYWITTNCCLQNKLQLCVSGASQTPTFYCQQTDDLPQHQGTKEASLFEFSPPISRVKESGEHSTMISIKFLTSTVMFLSIAGLVLVASAPGGRPWRVPNPELGVEFSRRDLLEYPRGCRQTREQLTLCRNFCPLNRGRRGCPCLNQCLFVRICVVESGPDSWWGICYHSFCDVHCLRDMKCTSTSGVFCASSGPANWRWWSWFLITFPLYCYL